MNEGDMEAAERSFKMYVRLAPDVANAHDSMGDFYAKQGDNEKRARVMRKPWNWILPSPHLKGKLTSWNRNQRFSRNENPDSSGVFYAVEPRPEQKSVRFQRAVFGQGCDGEVRLMRSLRIIRMAPDRSPKLSRANPRLKNAWW